MSRVRRRLAIPLVMGLIFLGGFVGGGAVADGGRLLRQVASLVDRYYVDPVDIDGLYEQAARDLLVQLGDPYAELYSPDQAETFSIVHEGNYGGAGMLIEDGVGPVAITRVFTGGPAERAGVRVGDRVRAVNGESVVGWPTDRIVTALRGKPGTRVRVGLARAGAGPEFEAELTRAVIRIPAVPYTTVLDGDVGYVPLVRFGTGSADQVRDAVRRVAARGARAVILDLRGNGGGIMDEAVDIAGLFLPRGSAIVDQRERNDRLTYRTRRSPVAPNLPLVVLIDNGSASASEIVAGALQDHDRALLVGEPTYGKGVIQRAYRLNDGWIAKFTTGRWYTPLGRSIHLDRDPETRRVVDHAAQADSAAWPRFRTPAGRVLAGPGGIRPDIAVSPRMADTPARALARIIDDAPQTFHSTVLDLALELRGTVDGPEFDVPESWRTELHRRLTAAGMDVDADLFETAEPALDRVIATRVADLAFGQGASLARNLAFDAPLSRAIDLLARAATQPQLFGAAAEAGATGF